MFTWCWWARWARWTYPAQNPPKPSHSDCKSFWLVHPRPRPSFTRRGRKWKRTENINTVDTGTRMESPPPIVPSKHPGSSIVPKKASSIVPKKASSIVPKKAHRIVPKQTSSIQHCTQVASIQDCGQCKESADEIGPALRSERDFPAFVCLFLFFRCDSIS